MSSPFILKSFISRHRVDLSQTYLCITDSYLHCPSVLTVQLAILLFISHCPSSQLHTKPSASSNQLLGWSICLKFNMCLPARCFCRCLPHSPHLEGLAFLLPKSILFTSAPVHRGVGTLCLPDPEDTAHYVVLLLGHFHQAWTSRSSDLPLPASLPPCLSVCTAALPHSTLRPDFLAPPAHTSL